MKTHWLCLAGIILAFSLAGCSGSIESINIEPPKKVDDGGSSSGDPSGGGSPGGGTEDPNAKEKERLARLGLTPVVCVYLTEYTPSSEFPDEKEIRYYTHVNYGHGRFVDKKNGTGLEIAKPEYLKKLASYKKNYPADGRGLGQECRRILHDGPGSSKA